MSEHTGNTQPIQPIKEDDTQPLKPVKPAPRWRSLLLSILGVVILLGLGGLGGYRSGINIRVDEQKKVLNSQLLEQFQYALVDEQFARYDAARQRLEYIIQNDPSFPGAQNELAKVLVAISIPTATPTPTLTPTPDLRGAEALFTTAQQRIAAGDWQNALTELDQLRRQEPGYKTSQVDGMYYFALRNYGVDMILQQGNLEGGIYQLTLAERFCPGCLDRQASGLRDGARAYINASSAYGTDWRQSVNLFAPVASGWPSLWDGTMTAAQRYWFSLMRFGDQLYAQKSYCDAYQQYETALSIAQLDQDAAKNASRAYTECYPPTETPTPDLGIPPLETPTP